MAQVAPTSCDRVLQIIHRLLQRDLTWPTWLILDHELDRVLGLSEPWPALAAIDRELLWGVGDREPPDDQMIGLSVAGLALCAEANEDLDIFTQSVRFAADVARQLERPEDVTLRPEDLVQNLRLPAAGRGELLTRQHAIWLTAGQLWSSLGGTPGAQEWAVQLNRRMLRRFRSVETVGDLLRAMYPKTVDEHSERNTATHAESTAQSQGAPPVRPTLTEHDPNVVSQEGSAASTHRGPGTESPESVTITTVTGTSYTMFPTDELGRGGQGIVYAGLDAQGQTVAIKRVHLRSFDTEKWYRDARYADRETAVHQHLAGQGLRHVLPLLDEVLDENWMTFIFPRADMSLADVVAHVHQQQNQASKSDGQSAAAAFVREHFGDQGPSIDQTKEIATELGRGLVELHAHGVVHRDIKPSNAFYYDGRWNWGDLGTARVIEAVTSTYTLADMGTRAYQAPEVTRGEPATERSDIYAFGCTCFALTTGKPPFEGPDVAHRHATETPNLRAIADTTVAYVIENMLSKPPGSRPTAEWVTSLLSRSSEGTGANTGLRRLGAQMKRREHEQDAARERVAVRNRAAKDALAQFTQLWDLLVAHIGSELPGVAHTHDQGAWVLDVGDRRIVVQIAEPADGRCPALQLGRVSVEGYGEDQRSHVANLLATVKTNGDPEWHLLRMVRNDLGVDKVPVSQARSDDLGAVSIQHLEEHIVQQAEGGRRHIRDRPYRPNPYRDSAR